MFPSHEGLKDGENISTFEAFKVLYLCIGEIRENKGLFNQELTTFRMSRCYGTWKENASKDS